MDWCSWHDIIQACLIFAGAYFGCRFGNEPYHK